MSESQEQDYKLGDLEAAHRLRTFKRSSEGTVLEQGETKVVAAVPTGSSPSIIEIQNALRLLTRVMKRDDELIFTGGDIIVFRDHLYRTQEISAMLGSNIGDDRRGVSHVRSGPSLGPS